MSRAVRVQWKMLCMATAAMMAIGVTAPLFSAAPMAGSGEQVTVAYVFQQPMVQQVDIAGETYDAVTMPDGTSASRPGEPRLPARGAYIVLPPGAMPGAITVTARDMRSLGTGYRVPPIGEATPLSQPAAAPPSPGSVYDTGEPFPGQLYDVVGVQSCRGYRVLILRLYPVQYVPATGQIRYYRHLSVTVSLDDAQEADLFRGLEQDRRVVMQQVDNPSMATRYTPPDMPGMANEDAGLLIITDSGLERVFTDLKEYHDGHDVQTVVATLDETGETPEEIRDYIRQSYIEQGISYVLLGGDVDVVPARQLWVEGMDENVTRYTSYMPADHYYGCLDGPYDGDGDGRWGEPTDGANGGDVDLMAEVYVGRAPVGDADEARMFVDKTIEYLSAEPSEALKSMTMIGEYLGDYGIATWGGNYVDQHIGSCSDDGYATEGIPADSFSLEKLYDRDWPGNRWSKEELLQRVNQGTHVVNHLGHSSYTYSMRMTPEDMAQFSNTDPCFMYSQGCMAGGFDQEDCMAEHFTVKTEHGAFAAIMNARYGWFWSYSTDGDSQRYQRQFWDAVFGEGITSLGRANQDSKEDNLHLIDRSCMRWTYYGLNLFGDPSVALRINNAPATPSAPVGEDNGETDTTYTYTTSTSDVEGDDIYYQWDWGDGTRSDWLGPYPSGAEVNMSHSWSSRGFYAVKVRARDGQGETSDWSNPLRVRMPYTLRLPMVRAVLDWLQWLFPELG
ncbi:MAG: C25 family cysteine peptidase [Thermoplasmatota archaeon]